MLKNMSLDEIRDYSSPKDVLSESPIKSVYNTSTTRLMPLTPSKSNFSSMSNVLEGYGTPVPSKQATSRITETSNQSIPNASHHDIHNSKSDIQDDQSSDSSQPIDSDSLESGIESGTSFDQQSEEPSIDAEKDINSSVIIYQEEEEEVFEVEPSSLVRSEAEDWYSWDHQSLAHYASQMNIALLQLAEDISQWRSHCSKLTKDGKAVYDEYVQQCHRLQRTSNLLKTCKKEVAQALSDLQVSETARISAEQKLSAQQERFKSNLEACQLLKQSVSTSNARVKELEASNQQHKNTIANLETKLFEREEALADSIQLAQKLSRSLEDSQMALKYSEADRERLEVALQQTQTQAAQDQQYLISKLEMAQREKLEYSKQIDLLASTPSDYSADKEVSSDISSSMTNSTIEEMNTSSQGVPSTPSRRGGLPSSDSSSPQRRVEALSIRVQMLRAHNATLEEQITKQAKSMKLQVEQATQNEMKWKQVAVEVQNDLTSCEAELNSLQSINHNLTSEISNLNKELEQSRIDIQQIPELNKKIWRLENALEATEQAKNEALDQLNQVRADAASAFKDSQALQQVSQELEHCKSLQLQMEDDMRLIYVQHKQEMTDLEARYKHKDYKSKYTQAVTNAALLHKKLSHVLQFVSTRPELVKLIQTATGGEEDMSSTQANMESWLTNGYLQSSILANDDHDDDVALNSSVMSDRDAVVYTPKRRATTAEDVHHKNNHLLSFPYSENDSLASETFDVSFESSSPYQTSSPIQSPVSLQAAYSSESPRSSASLKSPSMYGKVKRIRGGRVVGTPLLSKSSRRSSMSAAGVSASVHHSSEPCNFVQKQDISSTDSVSLVNSLISSSKAWKAKCETLALRIVALESLLIKTHQSHRQELEHTKQDYLTRINNSIEALQISHDATVARYEREAESQAASMDVQNEAFEFLKSKYESLLVESDQLKQNLSDLSSDLITYKAVYEETKLFESQQFSKQKDQIESQYNQEISKLQSEINSLQDEYKESLESHKQSEIALKDQIEVLRADLASKLDTIKFLDEEAQITRESEAENRNKLVQEYCNRIEEVELQLETQKLHMENQDSQIVSQSAQLAQLTSEIAQKDQIISQKDVSICYYDQALVAMAVAVQNFERENSKLKQKIEQIQAQLEQQMIEKVSAFEQLSINDAYLSRSRAIIQIQSLKLEKQEKESQIRFDQLSNQTKQAQNDHQAQISTLSSNLSSLQQEYDQLKSAYDSFVAENRQEKQSIEQNKMEQISHLQSLLNEQHEKLLAANDEISQLTLAVEESRTNFESTSKLFEETKFALEMCNKVLDQTKSSLDTTESQLMATNKSFDETKLILEDTLQALEKSENSLKTSVEELVLVQKSLSDKEKMNMELVEEKTRLLSDLSESGKMIERLQKSLSESQQEHMSKMSNQVSEIERLGLSLERLTTEYESLKSEHELLEQSRNQMESLTNTLENANAELVRSNGNLEKQLELEQEEKQKMLEKVQELQDSICQQTIARMQEDGSLNDKNDNNNNNNNNNKSNYNHSMLISSSSLISPDLASIYNEHHEWLSQMKDSLMKASQKYQESISARRLEFDQENACLRAQLAALQSKVFDLEETLDLMKDSEKDYVQDLSLAKLAHRQLILQIGALFSLISLANDDSMSSNQQEQPKNRIEQVANECNIAHGLKDVMSLERKHESLMRKLQHAEDEINQLKTKLSEAKLQMYEKEDLHLSQIRGLKVRCMQMDEQHKLSEQTRMQLTIFLGQVKEILVFNANIPAIRELLVNWIPKMNALVASALSMEN